MESVNDYITTCIIHLPDSTTLRLFSIYLPVTGNYNITQFRKNILRQLIEYPNDAPRMYLGDFNSFPAGELDHSRKFKHTFNWNPINYCINEHNLVDIWRIQYPHTRGFTHKATSGTRARIDFIFTQAQQISDWKIFPPNYCPFSDHSLLRIQLLTRKIIPKFPFFRPFPKPILQHEGYKKIVITYFENLCTKCNGKITPEKWLDIKASVKNLAWRLYLELRSKKQEFFEILELELERLYRLDAWDIKDEAYIEKLETLHFKLWTTKIAKKANYLSSRWITNEGKPNSTFLRKFASPKKRH